MASNSFPYKPITVQYCTLPFWSFGCGFTFGPHQIDLHSPGAVSHVLGTVSLASWDEAAVPYSALCFVPWQIRPWCEIRFVWYCFIIKVTTTHCHCEVLASGSTAAFTALPPVQALLLWILPAWVAAVYVWSWIPVHWDPCEKVTQMEIVRTFCWLLKWLRIAATNSSESQILQNGGLQSTRSTDRELRDTFSALLTSCSHSGMQQSVAARFYETLWFLRSNHAIFCISSPKIQVPWIVCWNDVSLWLSWFMIRKCWPWKHNRAWQRTGHFLAWNPWIVQNSSNMLWCHVVPIDPYLKTNGSNYETKCLQVFGRSSISTHHSGPVEAVVWRLPEEARHWVLAHRGQLHLLLLFRARAFGDLEEKFFAERNMGIHLGAEKSGKKIEHVCWAICQFNSGVSEESAMTVLPQKFYFILLTSSYIFFFDFHPSLFQLFGLERLRRAPCGREASWSGPRRQGPVEQIRGEVCGQRTTRASWVCAWALAPWSRWSRWFKPWKSGLETKFFVKQVIQNWVHWNTSGFVVTKHDIRHNYLHVKCRPRLLWPLSNSGWSRFSRHFLWTSKTTSLWLRMWCTDQYSETCSFFVWDIWSHTVFSLPPLCVGSPARSARLTLGMSIGGIVPGRNSMLYCTSAWRVLTVLLSSWTSPAISCTWFSGSNESWGAFVEEPFLWLVPWCPISFLNAQAFRWTPRYCRMCRICM